MGFELTGIVFANLTVHGHIPGPATNPSTSENDWHGIGGAIERSFILGLVHGRQTSIIFWTPAGFRR